MVRSSAGVLRDFFVNAWSNIMVRPSTVKMTRAVPGTMFDRTSHSPGSSFLYERHSQRPAELRRLDVASDSPTIVLSEFQQPFPDRFMATCRLKEPDREKRLPSFDIVHIHCTKNDAY
jgi:hypothetical protein